MGARWGLIDSQRRYHQAGPLAEEVRSLLADDGLWEIEKIPGTNTYTTTPEGIRAAMFYIKLRAQLLGPLLNAGLQPPAPTELRRALTTIDRTVATYINNARLGTAA